MQYLKKNFLFLPAPTILSIPLSTFSFPISHRLPISLLPGYPLFAQNVRFQKISFSQRYGSSKILVKFHGSCSLIFCTVLYVSQSQFFYEAVSESQYRFCNLNFKVKKSWARRGKHQSSRLTNSQIYPSPPLIE